MNSFKFPFNFQYYDMRILMIFFFFPFFLFGQIISENDSVKSVPKTIKNSEIALYSQKTRQLETDINLLIENEDEIEFIVSSLNIKDSLYTKNLETLNNSLIELSIDKLDRLENDINLDKNKTNLWGNDLNKWRDLTNQYNKDLLFYSKSWRLTADSIKVESKEFLKQDTTMIASLNKVLDQVERNYNRVITLTEDLSQWNKELQGAENAYAFSVSEQDEALELITSRKQNFIDNIWIPEHPPIWESPSNNLANKTEINLKDYFKDKLLLITQYLRNNKEFYYNLIFSFLLILGTISYLRKRANNLYRQDSKIVITNNVVLKRPLLSSIIILVYAIFFVFDIPDQLRYFIFLIAILPLSILLNELKSEFRNQYVFFFILFSLLFICLSAFSEAIKELRFVMLLINMSLLYILILIKKKKTIIEKENPYWLGTLNNLIGISIFFSILAIISNVIGSVQLSLVFTRTIIGTFLAFIVIKESVKLIQNFIYLLLLGPLYKVSNIIKEDNTVVMQWVDKFLRIASYVYWLYIILGLLKIREPVIDFIVKIISTPLVVGELSISLWNLLVFYLIMQISIWFSKFVRYFLEKEVYPRTHVDKGVSGTISLMLKYSIAFIGFLFALSGAGLELSKVVIGISALGVGIGFGLQNIVNNFVSGIILALERPITIGDIVKVDEIEGVVKDIGIRASQIRTWEGADVLVPNGYLISGKLTNWTFIDRSRRLDVEIHLSTEADISQVNKIILDAVGKVEDVSKTLHPIVNYEGIRDGHSIIKLYAWIDDLNHGFRVGTALRIAVFKALNKEGYDISIPVLDVSVKSEKDKGSSDNQEQINDSV